MMGFSLKGAQYEIQIHTLSADSLVDSADFQLAIESYKQRFHDQGLPPVSRLEASIGISRAYIYLSQTDSSVYFLQKGFQLAEGKVGKDDPSWIKWYHALGDYQVAARLFRNDSTGYITALGLLEKHPTLLELNGKVHVGLGNWYRRRRDFVNARVLLLRGLEVLKQDSTQHIKSLGAGYYALGHFYRQQQHPVQAISCFKNALSCWHGKLADAHPNRIQTFIAMGVCERVLGNYGSAMEYYRAAAGRTLFSMGADDPLLGVIYVQMGNCMQLESDYYQALSYYHKALFLQETQYGKGHPKLGATHNSLGLAYAGLDDFVHGSEHFEAALEIYRNAKLANSTQVASCYNNLGICLVEDKQFEKAIFTYKRALELYSTLPGDHRKYTASTLQNIGRCYFKLQDCESSIIYSNKALEVAIDFYGEYHHEVSRIRNNLGVCLIEQGQTEKAISALQKSLKTFDATLSLTETRQNPGLILGNSLSVMLNSVKYKALAFNRKSIRSGDLLDQQTAFQTYLLAVNLIDSIRQSFATEEGKIVLTGSGMKIYEPTMGLAYTLYNQTGDSTYLKKAISLVGKAKSALLYESILENEARYRVKLPVEWKAKERGLKQKITRVKKEIDMEDQKENPDKEILLPLQAKQFDLIQSLDSLSDSQGFLKLQKKLKEPRQNEDLKSLLVDDKTAVIEYFFGDSTLYALISKKNETAFFKLQYHNSLSAEIAELRNQIFQPVAPTFQVSGSDQKTYEYLAYELYQQLLGPFEKLLTPNLIVIPDGVIGYIPFEGLLFDTVTVKGNYKNYPYLLTRHTISYDYTSRLLGMTSSHKGSGKKWVGFAPDFGGMTEDLKANGKGSLAPLAYNQSECNAIAKLISGKAYTGKESTELNFKKFAKDYQIIHLSSHAWVNDSLPLYSAISLPSPDNEQDGFLEISELTMLSLPADLVVLSACETGIGKLFRGEGIASLARAFRQAGAKNIITTLWTVNDAATAEIMQSFYGHLLAGNPIDLSLSKAKKDYLLATDNLGAHPFYWAGYISLGRDEIDLNKRNGFVWWGFVFAGFALGLFALFKIWQRGKKD